MPSNSGGDRGSVNEQIGASDPWSALSSSLDPQSFAETWLEFQSRIVGPGVLQGVVVLGAANTGPFMPIAVWPKGQMGSPVLVTAIEGAIQKSQPVTIGGGRRPDADGKSKLKVDAIACPLLVDNEICGAVGFEVEHRPAAELMDIAEALKWGSGWLGLLVRQQKSIQADRLVAVIELMATALQHERFQGAATAVATELAGTLLCERVSIGFLKSKHVKIAALSHSASFGKKTNIIRAIEAAMDEAVDQQATMVHPNEGEARYQVTRAHEQLVTEHGVGTICTVPLAQGERMLGAITLERPRDNPFDAASVELCEHVAAVLGPLLDVKRKDDRLLIRKAADSFAEIMRNLVGPRHVILKVATYSALLLLAFFIFAKGDYRVTADARLEGGIQRAIATPVAGFVSEANVRAGDFVKEGDVMFALDDRDLRLERIKWSSQKSQYSREYAEALAKRDRAQTSVLAAQIEQAEANIALVEEQLSRIRGTAPFDGVVVSGDLSQSLGAPVERGDILFEVAPLDAYRVILKVEERDVVELEVGQTGQLVLTGMPSEKIPIVVNKITPVAIAEEGVNYFRIEAELTGDAPTVLRPGMEGVGKISVDDRRLIWIWTYKIRYWLRMFFWSWLP